MKNSEKTAATGLSVWKKSIGWIVVGALVVITLSQSCKHEPLETLKPNPIDTTGQGNGSGNGNGSGGGCSPDTAYFQRDVLPLIISNCAKSGCHDAASRQDGVVLTDYNSIINTGDVRAGRPGNSKLYRVLNETGSDRMPQPPNPPLTQAQKDLISKWITQGALNNNCTESVCNTDNVTYSATIKPILQNYCVGCHTGASAYAGVQLDNYNGASIVAKDSRLSGAVHHKSGYQPMPQGGPMLSDCDLKRIDKWITDGAPNN